MSAPASLDAQELLHLGIHAVGNNDPRQAMECLKRCLAIEPDHPQATYMLGAVYAQIGLYDRAKETLRRAVDLNPLEHTAAFQLGLLHLTSGEVEQAKAVWQALDALSADHFMNLFRSGLIALVSDQFSECVELLERGIAANTINEPLNADMRRLQDSARSAGAAATAQAQNGPVAAPGDQTSAPGSVHHFLERYRQQGPR